MGLLKSLKKIGKAIWGGVALIFKPLMKPIGKFLNSKIGKIIMIAISVFTMGAALLAGAEGFMAGTGFIGKFINGGKAFLNSLIGTNFAVEGAETAGAVGAAAGAAEAAGQAPMGVLEGADPAAVGGIAEAVPSVSRVVSGGAPVPPGVSPPAINPAVTYDMGGKTITQAGGAATSVAKESGNWLSKAADAAKEFAGSKGGQTIIGGMLQGYGRSQEIQAYLDEQARVGRMFENPDDPGMKMLREHDFSIDTPRGLAGASNELAQRSSRSRYAPAIPFRRPVPAGG